MGQTVTSDLTGDKVKNLKCHNSERNGHTTAKFWLFSSLVKFFQLTKNKEIQEVSIPSPVSFSQKVALNEK